MPAIKAVSNGLIILYRILDGGSGKPFEIPGNFYYFLARSGFHRITTNNELYCEKSMLI